MVNGIYPFFVRYPIGINVIFFSRSKIADFHCFSIDKRQLERRASMLNARTTHAFHIFDNKILGK
jgi:hypothetical protein